MLLDRLDPTGFHLLRGAAIDAAAPLTAAGRAVVRTADSAEDAVAAYLFAGSQNQTLHTELTRARRALIQAKVTQDENGRLRRALKLVEGHPTTIATARLIGSDFASPRRFATLSAGTRQGVAPGQPVIAADGLVGRILESGAIASRVLLLTDSESAVPVRLVRDETPALMRGAGDGTVIVHALLPGAAPFRKGDVVTTSGAGGIYAPDIPVATIAVVNGDTAIAWPLANPATLDFAIVERPYQPEPASKP